MLQERRLNNRGEQYVVGPTGTPLTLHDLPGQYGPLGDPPQGGGCGRRARRADQLDDALARYRLTAEEFLAWQKAIDKWGTQGLRTTRIQHYGRP